MCADTFLRAVAPFVERRWVAIFQTSLVASWVLHLDMLISALLDNNRWAVNYESCVLLLIEAGILRLIVVSHRRRQYQTAVAY